MERKWVSIEWVKNLLFVVGFLVIIGGLGGVIWQQIVNEAELYRVIDTYHDQAYQAANPREFSRALQDLNRALDGANMKEGNPYFLVPMSPHNDMSYRRARYNSFIERADELARHGVASTEVNTGLTDLRVAARSVPPESFWFWAWLQGGAWAVFWWPLIGAGAGLLTMIIAGMLPSGIRVRVRSPHPTRQ